MGGRCSISSQVSGNMEASKDRHVKNSPKSQGSPPNHKDPKNSRESRPSVISSKNTGSQRVNGADDQLFWTKASRSPDGEPDINPMDLIPMIVRREFISLKVQSVISENPAAAVKAKQSYKDMLNEGKVKLYKQKTTGMDIQTLKKLLNTVKTDWNLDTDTFPECKGLTKSIISGEWKQEKNIVEYFEMSPNKSECLLYNLQYEESKYHLALCHIIITDSTLSDSVVVGGLLSEGLLAKDEKKNVYLQF